MVLAEAKDGLEWRPAISDSKAKPVEYSVTGREWWVGPAGLWTAPVWSYP